MKLKTIASIFKHNKSLVIWEKLNGEQWITNGHAAYVMDGMPPLTPEFMLKIFDIPKDKQGERHCEHSKIPEDVYALFVGEISNFDTREVTMLETSIVNDGTTFVLFDGGADIVAVDEQLIKPLYDNSDYLRFYKREYFSAKNQTTTIYLLCYVGFDFKAVIASTILGERFRNEIRNISSYYNSQRYKDVQEQRHLPARKPFEINPETGEVLDDETDEAQETFADDTDASESEEQPEKKTSRKRAGK